MKLAKIHPKVATIDLRQIKQVEQGSWGKGRGGRTWARIAKKIRIRDDYTCQACGITTEDGECDHIVPMCEGGTDDESNLQYLCIECHRAKTQEEAARARSV